MPADIAPSSELFRCVAALDLRSEDSLEQNQSAWRDNDPFAALKGGAVKRYVRATSRRSDKRAYRPRTWLGAAEFWVQDLDAAVDLAKALKARTLVHDHPVLRDASATVLVTREKPIIAGDANAKPPLRGLFFVKRKPGMSVEDYQAYWLNVHGQMVIGTPGITRYLQCQVCPETYDALSPQYDGMAEMTWSGEDGMTAFEESPQSRVEQANDLPNLFDLKAGFRFFITEEAVF